MPFPFSFFMFSATWNLVDPVFISLYLYTAFGIKYPSIMQDIPMFAITDATFKPFALFKNLFTEVFDDLKNSSIVDRFLAKFSNDCISMYFDVSTNDLPVLSLTVEIIFDFLAACTSVLSGFSIIKFSFSVSDFVNGASAISFDIFPFFVIPYPYFFFFFLEFADLSAFFFISLICFGVLSEIINS